MKDKDLEAVPLGIATIKDIWDILSTRQDDEAFIMIFKDGILAKNVEWKEIARAAKSMGKWAKNRGD